MQNKKVYLIKVPHQYHIHDRNWPLGLMYLCSYLKSRDINTSIVDLSGKSHDDWDIPLDGDYYGVSCTTPDYHHAVKIAEHLKSKTSAKLILGGVHATARPEEVLSGSLFDIVVMGEGELTMYDIVSEKPLLEIPGIRFRDGDEIIRNPRRPLIDQLDMLAPPVITDIDYLAYAQPVIIKDPESIGVSMITARGCPYKCIFCASALMWQRNIRFHSAEYLLNEIRSVMDLGIHHFFFCDDTFLINKSRTMKLLHEFKKLGITWRCSATTNMFTRELAKKMADSGCRQVDFGIESGSDRMLAMMKKGSRRHHHETAIQNARDAGIMTKAMLMVGLPGESESDVLETVRFVKENDADMYALTAFVPLPGCDVAERPDHYNYHVDTSTTYKDYFIVGSGKDTPILHENKEQVEAWRAMIWEAIGERATLDVIAERQKHGSPSLTSAVLQY